MEETTPDIMFADKDPATRLAMLNDNCTSTDTDLVKRFFTKDEIDEMKNDLSSTGIERSELEDHLKEESKILRDKIKALKATEKGLLKNLKRKFTEKTEQVFYFANQEEGIMCAYNTDGEFINSRKLLPSERQHSIFDISKSA